VEACPGFRFTQSGLRLLLMRDRHYEESTGPARSGRADHKRRGEAIETDVAARIDSRLARNDDVA